MMQAPIHTAVKSGNARLVEFLLDNGANCDVRDAILETPLHSSCKCGDDMLVISKYIFYHLTELDTGGEIKWMLGPLHRSDSLAYRL